MHTASLARAAHGGHAPTPACPTDGAGTAQPAHEVFQRIGLITRQLHDALHELGYDASLERAMGSLPDARQRLSYIANLTGRAAEKVLGAVERGQAMQSRIESDARELHQRWEAAIADPAASRERGEVEALARRFLASLPERSACASGVLTEIMMAQDFHDLTGQVIQRVVSVAQNLEDQLVKLLLETSPPERRAPAQEGTLAGPVIDATGRDDVVTSQSQVDDLLESMGF